MSVPFFGNETSKTQKNRLNVPIYLIRKILTFLQYPQIFGGAKPDAALLKKLEEALVFLNTFLEGHTYAVGDKLTLADLSLVATVSTIDATEIVSLDKYPNIQK